jgi:hypothetical protein
MCLHLSLNVAAYQLLAEIGREEFERLTGVELCPAAAE